FGSFRHPIMKRGLAWHMRVLEDRREILLERVSPAEFVCDLVRVAGWTATAPLLAGFCRWRLHPLLRRFLGSVGLLLGVGGSGGCQTHAGTPMQAAPRRSMR